MTAPGGSLSEWIRRFGAAGPGESASDAGLRALEASLERPGRDREGAWALLAADALLTEACEEAVARAVEDPEERLEALLRRVSEVPLP